MKKLTAVFASLLLTSLHCHAAEGSLGDIRYVTPAQRVDIGDGRQMNMLCLGEGSPAVILEAGAGSSMYTWMSFQPRVATHTRVCAYDRAGFGFSSPSPNGITSQTVTRDLHAMLTAAGIKPPYIMVGHSFGGMLVRHFAATYKNEVAALVLIDPFTEDQARRYWKLDPDRKLPDDEETARLRDCLVLSKANFNNDPATKSRCVGRPGAGWSPEVSDAYVAMRAQPGYLEARWAENLSNFSLSTFQMYDVDRNLGDRPLIVLTRTPAGPSLNETPAAKAAREARNAILISLHDDVAAFSTRGQNRIIEKTGHNIHVDQPAAVEAAIVEVLDITRGTKAGQK